MLAFIREHLVQTSKAALGFLDWSICSGNSCHHSPSLHLVLSFTLFPAPYLFFLCWKQVGCDRNPSFSLSHLCGCVVWGTFWTLLGSLAFILLCCHLSVSFSDWWPSIIYVISVFITKCGSVTLSHLEWLYILTTLFPDNKLPLWTASSLPWFSFCSVFFFFLAISDS